MRVDPVIVPIELFGIPLEQCLLVFTNPLKERAYVVGAIDVSVLDRERVKHLKRFFRLARDFFETVNALLRAVNHIRQSSAAPTRARAVKQR